MDTKEMLKKNLLTILSAIALLALALTFFSLSTKSEYGPGQTISYSGFSTCGLCALGYLLIVGPVLLVAMNYISQLEKYKGIISAVTPVICLVILVVVYFMAKDAALAAQKVTNGATEAIGGMFGGEPPKIKVEAPIGFGMILYAITMVGMIVYGIKTQKDFSLKNVVGKMNVGGVLSGLEGLKNTGVNFVNNVASKVSGATGGAAADGANNVNNVNNTNNAVDRTQEVLVLIERLAKMKADGILTEEEFAEKKKSLLEEI